MRVLLLSWSDLSGGAARAAYRLHRALRGAGAQPTMLVTRRASEDPDVVGPASPVDRVISRLAARIDQLPLSFYRLRKPALFTPAFASNRTIARAVDEPHDVTHLHWLGNGSLRVESLPRLSGPLVWTLHDLWAFTGGCHYSDGCGRFQEECGKCPLLGSRKLRDLSHRVWKRKRENWQRADLTIVTPSRWMARQAAVSTLLTGRPIHVIPNCLDTEVFHADDRQAARQALGLPQDKRILMFGAMTAEGDRRKGFHLLASALNALVQGVRADGLHLVVLGMSRPAVPPAFPIAASFLGILEREEAMAQAYSAADVFVAPSMEDNLPNTVMEALACGVPCVAFDVGGMPDLIDHWHNGYLAQALDPADLAKGVAWVLEDVERLGRLRESARAKVLETFAPTVVAGQHLALYRDLIAAKRAELPAKRRG